MKKQMKFIIIIIFIIVVFLIIAFMNLRIKGYKSYGNDYCNTNHTLECGGDALTDWSCRLCGKRVTNPDTNVPEICNMCSYITGRCNKCGRLEK